MDQRVFSGIGREIAELRELKQVRNERGARHGAFAQQGKRGRQQNEPADQVGNGQHDDQRGKDPPDPATVEGPEREAVSREFAQNDPGDQEAGNHEEDIDPDEAAGRQPGLGMVGDHQQNGERPQSVDVRAIGEAFVLVAGPAHQRPSPSDLLGTWGESWKPGGIDVSGGKNRKGRHPAGLFVSFNSTARQ